MVNPIKAGLAFGTFIALAHLGWSILVAAGGAQKLIDFIFWAHFITPLLQVEPFDLLRACVLIGVTFAVAFAAAAIGSVIWNLFHRA